MKIRSTLKILLFALLALQSQASTDAPVTFMEDGGWCWYQDPRALIQDGKLVVGSISGRSGDVRISVYDLKTDHNLGTTVVHKNFQRDDHNTPAFYTRPDGRILIAYARHNSQKVHHFRISESDDFTQWSPQNVYKHDYTKGSGVTYMNLHYLKDEGLLYNFYRDGETFNPAFITSADQGETWGNRTHFIADEVGGRHRPYLRYLQRDANTVGITFTEAHPRVYGNSLYYADFRDGSFYNVDGSKIKNLTDGPLRPSEAQKIYQGSATKQKPTGYESVPQSAWTSSVASDANQNPHVGYTLYISNKDHRYRLASWNGSKWIDREVAYAGTCLYEKESSYTGLITLDPEDPTQVYISTDVDPHTGQSLGGTYEIYTAKIDAEDNISNIDWKSLTQNSAKANIRPIVVTKDGYKVLLWLHGDYRTYIDYELDVQGLILEKPNSPVQAQVKSVMQRVADWQIKHLRDDYNRVHAHDDRLVAWTYGALYAGMVEWAALADDDRYYKFLYDIGEELNWKLGWGSYHADEHVVAQMYLELYRKYGESKMLKGAQRRMDTIIAKPSTQPMRLGNYEFSERWTWCDALFMAPPVWAKLSSITGESAYRDWMFSEYKATTEHLFDPETKLFFRDNNFIERRQHGRKVFWARGNGWVFASLPLIIGELPEGEQRDYYEKLFQSMALALAELQTEDGHWAMSLLAADIYPTPETSGTAFFTYGLAWGINNGLLDRATYEPIVKKAWQSLISHVTEDGLLGYVQPVGAAPGKAWPDKTEVYGTGAFLLAGSEVYKLLEND